MVIIGAEEICTKRSRRKYYKESINSFTQDGTTSNPLTKSRAEQMREVQKLYLVKLDNQSSLGFANLF